jgi:hypothetical protein
MSFLVGFFQSLLNLSEELGDSLFLRKDVFGQLLRWEMLETHYGISPHGS